MILTKENYIAAGIGFATGLLVAKTKKRRSDVILAYERIVEGRPDLAKEITKGFEIATVGPQNVPVITVDFDKLINDLARVELLWNEYLEMEDEDVMVLL